MTPLVTLKDLLLMIELRILVLDHGRVVEFGTPWELMQKEDGSFRDLCRQSGEESQLFEVSPRGHIDDIGCADMG